MQKEKIIILFLFLFFLMTSVVKAETNTETMQKERKLMWEEKRKKMEEMKMKQKEWREQKCVKIQNKMQNRITNFEEGKVRRLNAYNNLQERISKFIERAKERGYDTEELEKNLEVLKGKIAVFSEKYKAFITKMRGMQTTCKNTEEKFRGNLQEAKTVIKDLRESAQDIKNYVADTIRPNIKKLKYQKPQTNKNDSENGVEQEDEQ